MAKNESTAVNDLINRMTTMTPLRPDPADDLMFRAPAPRRRAANGTPPITMTMKGLGPVTLRAPAAAAAAAPRPAVPGPESMPVAAPFDSTATLPFDITATLPLGRTIEAGPGRAWFEQAHQRLNQSKQEETWVGTMYVRGRSSWKSLVAPIVVIAILGAFAGGYFAFEARGGKLDTPKATLRAAPAAMAAGATKTPAAPAAIPTPIAPAFVDVMIVSAPAGATVTLVDRGKTSFIGTTPIATALDPSRKYELVFSHPGKPTWIEPIDPSTTRRVDVKLGRAEQAEQRPASPARAERGTATPTPAPTPTPAAAPAPAPAPARAHQPAAAPAAAPAGNGVLMISSKPPCEIVIDGQPTGLMTPQRELPLPAGSHKVTLVNKAERIRKTIAVQISADQPTKVIQDLMK
jgi:hypothetical protein